MTDEMECIIDLIEEATEDIHPSERREIKARVRQELVMSPKFSYLEGNIWHWVDSTVAN
jgi:hypothetical protein